MASGSVSYVVGRCTEASSENFGFVTQFETTGTQPALYFALDLYQCTCNIFVHALLHSL
jgi:hypothetical protein